MSGVPKTLSVAQVRVLDELLLDGADNPVIANRLHLALDTVKSHMKALLEATGCTNRTALVVAFMRGDVWLDWPVTDEAKSSPKRVVVHARKAVVPFRNVGSEAENRCDRRAATNGRSGRLGPHIPLQPERGPSVSMMPPGSDINPWTSEIRRAALEALNVAASLHRASAAAESASARALAYYVRSSIAHGLTVKEISAATGITVERIMQLSDPAVAS